MPPAKAIARQPSRVRMLISALIVVSIVVLVWWVIDYRQRPPPPPNRVGERVEIR